MRAMRVLAAVAMAAVSTFPSEAAEGEAVSNPKDVLTGFYEAIFNAHDLGAIDRYLAEDIVDHNPDPGQAPGKAGVKAFFEAFLAAFPDLRIELQQVVAEGDSVAARSTLSGTQHGAFMGLPPAGRSFRAQLLDFVTVKDGKVAERWGSIDAAAMMQQLSP